MRNEGVEVCLLLKAVHVAMPKHIGDETPLQQAPTLSYDTPVWFPKGWWMKESNVQSAVQPPSTRRDVPVTRADASEARNTIAPIRSSIVPMRPTLIRARTASSACSLRP